MANDANHPAVSREKRFVAWVIERCSEDSGFAADLARADNPNTQSRSWPALAAFGVDLENPRQREPYALVAAFLARRRKKNGSNGGLPLGRALLASYEYKADSPSGSARMRRLLSATDTVEVCALLRPMLSLIASRDVSIDMGSLLEDLSRFHYNPTKVKSKWAQEFYRLPPKDESGQKKGAANGKHQNVSAQEVQS